MWGWALRPSSYLPENSLLLSLDRVPVSRLGLSKNMASYLLFYL